MTPPPRRTPQSSTTTFLQALTAPNKIQDVDVFFENAGIAASQMETSLSTIIKTTEKQSKTDRGLCRSDVYIENISSDNIYTNIINNYYHYKTKKKKTGFNVDCVETVNRLSNLAADESEIISSNLKRISKALQNLSIAYSNTSTYHMNIFSEFWKQCMKRAESVQFALNHRLQILYDYDQSCKSTQKRITNIERLKSSSNIRQDKVEIALEELAEVNIDCCAGLFDY